METEGMDVDEEGTIVPTVVASEEAAGDNNDTAISDEQQVSTIATPGPHQAEVDDDDELTDESSVLQLNLTGDSLQKFARILHEKGLHTAEDAMNYFYSLHVMNESSEKRPRGRPKGAKNKAYATSIKITKKSEPEVDIIIPEWTSTAPPPPVSDEKGTVVVEGRRKSTRARKNPYKDTEYVPIPRIEIGPRDSDISGDEDEWNADREAAAAEEEDEEEEDEEEEEGEDDDEEAPVVEVDDVTGEKDDLSRSVSQAGLTETLNKGGDGNDNQPSSSAAHRQPRKKRKMVRIKPGRPRMRAKDVTLTDTEKETGNCAKCGEHYNKQSELTKHKQTKHGRPGHPYFCDHCDYTAMFACDMKRHQFCHSIEKKFACEICDFKTNWERNVTLHMENVHSDKEPWKCDKCEAKVYNHAKVKQHQLSHNPLAKKCPNCPLLFEKDTHLHTHMNVHKRDKTHKCDECSYSTTFSSNLKSHKRQKHFATSVEKSPAKQVVTRQKRTIACDICNKLWATEDHRQVHMQIHEADNKDQAKPYYCEHCDSRSQDLNQMVRHKAVHIEEKPFSCAHCSYKTRWKKDLKTHSMIHTGEKGVKCPHCSYSCYTRQRLRAHMLKHDDTRRFVCQLCNMSFKSKQALRMHTMYHTGDATFSCDVCDFRTVTELRLRKHKLRHTDERNYACNLCGKRFKQAHHVTQHRDIVHLGKPSYREKKRIALQQSAAEALGSLNTADMSFAGHTMVMNEDGTTTLVDLSQTAVTTDQQQQQQEQYVMVETPTGYQYVAVVMPEEGGLQTTSQEPAQGVGLIVDGAQAAENSTLEDGQQILLTNADGTQMGVYYTPTPVSGENSQAVETLVALQP